jgi:galactose oxidase-like protein
MSEVGAHRIGSLASSRTGERGRTLWGEARASVLALALLALAPGHRTRAQNIPYPEGSLGHWDGPYYNVGGGGPNDEEITALALIPTGPEAGRVIFWRKNVTANPTPPPFCAALTITPRLWDPAAPNSSTQLPVAPDNVFCSGFAFSPDGSLVTLGGIGGMGCDCPGYPLPPWPNYAHVFDTLDPFGAAGSPWSPQIPLVSCDPRYYPTLLGIASGDLLGLGGGSDSGALPPAGCSGFPLNLNCPSPPFGPPPQFVWNYFSDSFEILNTTTLTWQGAGVGQSFPGLPAGVPACPAGQVQGTDPDRSLLWFPTAHLLSTGTGAGASARSRVFISGAGTTFFPVMGSTLPHHDCESYLLEVGGGPPPAWTLVASSARPRRYGSSVMLPKMIPGDPDRIMIFGGTNVRLPVPPDPPSPNPCPPFTIFPSACDAANTAQIITSPDQPGAAWGPEVTMGPTGSPAPARVNLNTVILPNGWIFVVGGTTREHVGTPGCQCSTITLQAVRTPVVYMPASNTWAFMADHVSPRTYHCCALLLPDGRVLVAGGVRGQFTGLPDSDMEVWSPPYLYWGERPTIMNPSFSSLGYGSTNNTLTVQTASGVGVGSLVLVRPGCVTHAFDFEQRLQGLSFSVTQAVDVEGGGTQYRLSVNGPLNEHAVPPGYYMLFALTPSGIPSVARFVHVP